MPKRNANWFDPTGRYMILNAKIFNTTKAPPTSKVFLTSGNDPHPNQAIYDVILAAIESTRWNDPDITKTEVVLEALYGWALWVLAEKPMPLPTDDNAESESED
jgi:hypothetical protein